ncbi:MAG: hypothetical protein U0793_10965 [Gemmataceae bacterium]
MAGIPKINVELVGPDEDQGAVQLNDLRLFCEHLETCLHRVEDLVSPGARLTYLVDDLRKGSAGLTLVAKKPKQGPDTRQVVVKTFNDVVDKLENGRPLPDVWPSDALLAFRRLAEPLNKRLKAVRVDGVPLTTSFIANIDRIVVPKITTEGYVKGRLERVNLHNLNEFVVYSPLGYDVKCTFEEELFPEVQRALKATVTVFGRLHYREDSVHPDRVDVKSLEIHPPDDELPRLRDLKGTWAGATGGLTAAEFLRSIRHE